MALNNTYSPGQRSLDGGFRKSECSFNMTPVIDIVFQLIIFFALVCQFIEAENFPIKVPDDCRFAAMTPQEQNKVTTLTVMKTENDRIAFAVGAEKIDVAGATDLVDKLAEKIDGRMQDLPARDRIVTLRIDKDVTFAQAQYALAALAQSSAQNIRLAALKEKQNAAFGRNQKYSKATEDTEVAEKNKK
jgi:biopolymer transport protein ExbD